ncbi:microcystin-dependent protein [Deinobacterium chartae]|uniref:Microcystin-dependent protein n=1 Tax=Deinobacterium chartae TaxID=521158 RepID=A0A841I6Y0_9DEIO|nr:tail fiber protein [Deinobacterium chartae]MBB6099989.1 microcystin-dependent protein [Deinobacterium chartae]
MAEPFISEIRIFTFNFAPKGWATCNGQLLPINQNQALFSLLGTAYGGNGQTNFALPNLQGRVPVHAGEGLILGQSAGTESHTLNVSEIPEHVHLLSVSNANANQTIGTGNVLAAFSGGYAPDGPAAPLHPATISNAGGSQPHENRQPFLTLNFCIALQGIFPSQS